MNSVENAYERLAEELYRNAPVNWNQIFLQAKILEKNCGAMNSTLVTDNGEKSIELSMSSVFGISDACIFLRDDLLKANGNRIWGLRFTLYPTGKFNIEYDYNKPVDYEE